jgi:hypothetical protein
MRRGGPGGGGGTEAPSLTSVAEVASRSTKQGRGARVSAPKIRDARGSTEGSGVRAKGKDETGARRETARAGEGGVKQARARTGRHTCGEGRERKVLLAAIVLTLKYKSYVAITIQIMYPKCIMP